MKNKFVLVRTFSAGVHTGVVLSLEAGTKVVTLKNARRVWRWKGANTLHELSQKGGDEQWTRISEPVPLIVLTETIEVIPCSKAGRENLERSRWPQ